MAVPRPLSIRLMTLVFGIPPVVNVILVPLLTWNGENFRVYSLVVHGLYALIAWNIYNLRHRVRVIVVACVMILIELGIWSAGGLFQGFRFYGLLTDLFGYRGAWISSIIEMAWMLVGPFFGVILLLLPSTRKSFQRA